MLCSLTRAALALALAAAPSAVLAGTGSGAYRGRAGQISGFNASLVEPNSPKYVNYCGPASSRVLISAWTRSVPGLDALAAQEHTSPRGGTQPGAMVGPINRAIGRDYYRVTHARTQAELGDIIGRNILGERRPLIVGLKTRPPGATRPSLDGWDHSVSHFVMVYGFDFRRAGAGYVDYFEIASALAAGRPAAGRRRIGFDDFWRLASLYDVQIAGR